MSSVIISGDVSGTVTLQAPGAAGSAVVTLQAVSGTMLLNNSSDQVINGLTVGKGAGAVSTNTAVGASALAANTTGLANTAVGYQAGTALTTPTEISLFGYQAGKALTTGYGDAFGASALSSSTTGTRNAAFGYQSLLSTTTGGSNTAVGYQSLQANTTASNNTAVGYQAGYSNTTGAVNVFVGRKAGYAATTADGNVFIGDSAGVSVTTGYANTFIGPNWAAGGPSGGLITTGSKNTIIGSFSGYQSGLDFRTSSNNIVLSDGDGNPRAWYTVDAGNLWNFPAFYSATTASAANMNIQSDGYVRRSTSALKYKQDIRDVEDFDISALRPVRYKSKCEGDDQTKDHFGLIADEAAAAGFEELVTRGADGEVEGFQYERLTVVLLKELQTLKAKVTALENK